MLPACQSASKILTSPTSIGFHSFNLACLVIGLPIFFHKSVSLLACSHSVDGSVWHIWGNSIYALLHLESVRFGAYGCWCVSDQASKSVSWISGPAQDACHGVGLPASLKDEVLLHSALHHTLHHLKNHYHYLSIHLQKLYLPVFCLQSHFWSKTKYLSSIFHHLCNYIAHTSTCFNMEENK